MNLLPILISMTTFIFAASIHEFAHGWTAYRLGDDTAKLANRLTINPIRHIDLFGTLLLPIFSAISGVPVIGWMLPVPVNNNNFKNPSKGMAIVSFAGPYSNLLQALIGISLVTLLGKVIPANTLSHSFMTMLFSIIQTYYTVNIVLMIFNLLPFPPLDGGWILRYLLPYKAKESFDRFYPYGQMILFALLIFGFLRVILNFLIPLFFIPINFLNGIHFSLIFVLLLFAFIPLLVFIVKTANGKTKIDQMKQKMAKNENKLKIMRVETIKNALVFPFLPIYNKLKANHPLTGEDNEILKTLRYDISQLQGIDNSLLCPPIDYNPLDNYCQNCAYFHGCIDRFITAKSQSSL